MTLAEQALSFDRERRILAAVETYEQAIKSIDAPLWAILNLEGIYWDACSGPGCRFPDVQNDLLNRSGGGDRLLEIMQIAKARFPESTVAEFWRRYILMRWLDDDFPQDACQQIFDRDPSEQTPLLYLYAFPGGRKWEPEARQLLARFKAEGTVLATSAASFLTSVMKHYDREDQQRKRNGDAAS